MRKSPKIHRTPLYRAKAAYRNMKARCLNANGKNPAYSNVELKMSMNEFCIWAIPLYKKFIENNPELNPSVSRFNDTGHYEISNIEIVSCRANRKRMATKLHIQDGRKLCSICREVKDVKDFCINKTKTSGLSNDCRECKAEISKRYRDKKKIRAHSDNR